MTSLSSQAFASPDGTRTYRVLDCLGQGGMGAVYKGICDQSGETVAVKVALADLASDGERRLAAEWAALQKVRSPHLPRVLGLARSGDQWGIVMEFLGGDTLYDAISRDLGGERRLELAGRVAAALSVAVRELIRVGVVHRDIKPENILFAGEGRPVLVDLGLAFEGVRTRLTATGMVLGTPTYLAPEQLQPDRHPTPKIDLYQLGLVVLDVLTGMGRRQRERDFSEVIARCKEDVRLPAGVAVSVPFRAWLEECLRCQPEDRPDPDTHLRQLPAISTPTATTQREQEGTRGVRAELHPRSPSVASPSASTGRFLALLPFAALFLASLFFWGGTAAHPPRFPGPAQEPSRVQFTRDSLLVSLATSGVRALRVPLRKGVLRLEGDGSPESQFAIPLSALVELGDELTAEAETSAGETFPVRLPLAEACSERVRGLLEQIPQPPDGWMGGLGTGSDGGISSLSYRNALFAHPQNSPVGSMLWKLHPSVRALLRIAPGPRLRDPLLERLLPGLVLERLSENTRSQGVGIAAALVQDFWAFGGVPVTPRRYSLKDVGFTSLDGGSAPLLKFSPLGALLGSGSSDRRPTRALSLRLQLAPNEIKFLEIGLWVSAAKGNICFTLESDAGNSVLLPVTLPTGWNYVFLPAEKLLAKGQSEPVLRLAIGLAGDPSFENLQEIRVDGARLFEIPFP